MRGLLNNHSLLQANPFPQNNGNHHAKGHKAEPANLNQDHDNDLSKSRKTLPVSKTTSPFTQIAEVAVNKASSRPIDLPVEEE